MKSIRTKVAVATVLSMALTGTAVSASAATTEESAGPSSSIVASQAFATAAAGGEEGQVSPQAIPAIVGTAFVSGAATAAGAAVGDWVAKKITGIWSVEQSVQDPAIFD